MNRIFPWALGFTLLLVGLAVFLPGGRQAGSPGDLPWQIELLPDGYSQVFGLTLGKSTLGDVERKLQEDAVISMFVTADDHKVVEGFFKDTSLAGFKAKMVFTLALDDTQLQQIYDRGARIATLGSGQRKVSLNGEDLELVRATPIRALTYLPSANLNAELVEKRFGKPEQTINEPESDMIHWLYPSKGLDIGLSDKDKDVLQYVSPKDFGLVVKPLSILHQ